VIAQEPFTGILAAREGYYALHGSAKRPTARVYGNRGWEAVDDHAAGQGVSERRGQRCGRSIGVRQGNSKRGGPSARFRRVEELATVGVPPGGGLG